MFLNDLKQNCKKKYLYICYIRSVNELGGHSQHAQLHEMESNPSCGYMMDCLVNLEV